MNNQLQYSNVRHKRKPTGKLRQIFQSSNTQVNQGKDARPKTPNRIALQQNDLYKQACYTIQQQGQKFLTVFYNDIFLQMTVHNQDAVHTLLELVKNSNNTEIRGPQSREEFIYKTLSELQDIDDNTFLFSMGGYKQDITLYEQTPSDGYCGYSVLDQLHRRTPAQIQQAIQKKQGKSPNRETVRQLQSKIQGENINSRVDKNRFTSFLSTVTRTLNDADIKKKFQDVMQLLHKNTKYLPNDLWLQTTDFPSIIQSVKDKETFQHTSIFNTFSIQQTQTTEEHYIPQQNCNVPDELLYKLPLCTQPHNLPTDWIKLYYYAETPGNQEFFTLGTLRSAHNNLNAAVHKGNHYFLYPIPTKPVKDRSADWDTLLK